MCMKTECDKCEKPTWKGCGKHIEQALKDVPVDERCKCPRDSPASTTTEMKKPDVEKSTTDDAINKDQPVKTETTDEIKDKAE